jgi:hypothetical protein
MPIPRVRVEKQLSPWGNSSYDLYVDNEFVGNYRLKADAARAGLASLERKKEEERQEIEADELEFGQ